MNLKKVAYESVRWIQLAQVVSTSWLSWTRQ